MITITIRGTMSAANDLARQRYREHVGMGRHVLLDIPGDLRNSLPGRRLTVADVLITAKHIDQPISETTTD